VVRSIQSKIGWIVILAAAVPVAVAGAIESIVRSLNVTPVDERDVEIGELRAALERAHQSLGAEVNARFAAEMEGGRLKSEASRPTWCDVCGHRSDGARPS
jgi:hypothetical protein